MRKKILSIILVAAVAVFAHAYPAVDCDGQPVVGYSDNLENLTYTQLEGGYCNHLEYWVNGILGEHSYYYGTIPENTTADGAAIVYRGHATWYDPEIMEESARQNGIDLAGCSDGTAVMFGRPIGQGFPYRFVWVKRSGEENFESLPMCIADAAGREDVWGHVIHNGSILEVGNQTAVRWGLVQYDESGKRVGDTKWKEIGIEVYFGDQPPSEYIVIDYVDWWMETARFQYGGSTRSYWEILQINPSP